MISLLSCLMFMALTNTGGGGDTPSKAYPDFRIYLAGVEVYDLSPSSLKLKSQQSTYKLKLQPETDGKVTFALGRYGFRTNLKTKGLAFGIRIQGYKDGAVMPPTLHVEDDHPQISYQDGMVTFPYIHMPVPVSFPTPVDSVLVTVTNSFGLDVHQYLSLDDLKIIDQSKTVVLDNPPLKACDHYAIMFGIEGSSAVEKNDRKVIAKHLLDYFKQPATTLDSNSVCLMEFGKSVRSVEEASHHKAIAKKIKGYKKSAPSKKEQTAAVNWIVALDQAIERRPDIFIFVTSRWSNFSADGPSSFHAQYETLVNKCNTLKSQGTRLMFVTSGLSGDDGGGLTTLHSLLDHEHTKVVHGYELEQLSTLRGVDMITLDDMGDFSKINLASLLNCE